MYKKYDFLDQGTNHSWLKEQLQTKSMAMLAKELAAERGLDADSLAGCIRFLVYKYFTKHERDLIKKERAFHRNRRRK